MSFLLRHIGNFSKKGNVSQMLKACNFKNLDNMISKTGVYTTTDHDQPIIAAQTEVEALAGLSDIVNQNKAHTSYIGLGYHRTHTPAPIKRHIVENPQWYTAYTPYQSEISQGRLESQFNYQTVIEELTDLPISNGSLLDEASAAGEALNLSYSYFRNKRDKFIVADDLHPYTLDVLDTRSRTLGINMDVVNMSDDIDVDYDELCNIIFQYPNTHGDIIIPFDKLESAKQSGIITTGVTDLLALTKVITPGELGLDIALGNTQRFGIPLWYGGPHPAYFAVSNRLLRHAPGRIIGKSKDKYDNEAYRLALQTREQHIKRSKATSNICTSQSLLTNVVSFYGIYNGPEGLTNISNMINNHAKKFLNDIKPHVHVVNNTFYDTIAFKVNDPDSLIAYLQNYDILIRKIDNHTVSVTFDETTKDKDVNILTDTIKSYVTDAQDIIQANDNKPYSEYCLPDHLRRKTKFMTQDVFNKYHTETDLMRYMNRLAAKDYTLCNGMIPMGSCTMKLNASYQLEPLMWDKIANVHPYVPPEYALGYKELIETTGNYFKNLTGFNHVSFQPNSGATGEYSGLLCIKGYHADRGDKRDICLIPKSAHGTNFASASVANLTIKTFDDKLLDDIDSFQKFVSQYGEKLACLMITYPNTTGVFQENIKDIVDIIHDEGGLVYMDGANMNALIGTFRPGDIDFDVCHLNLHKTFCIPHGGGGPGLGPILCNDKLAPYLPTNRLQIVNQPQSTDIKHYVSSSNWSSAALLTIPYLYISAMGSEGLKTATQMAILHSNYLKNALKDHYTIIDTNKNDMVGHEFIIDATEFKSLGITDNDIAKRLIDYSFHPPTMSWPRPSVLMFEPTESESKDELDRLVTAMISIRNEIREIENGEYDVDNNVLKNAPHTFTTIDNWPYTYSYQKAFYPVDTLRENKFIVPVGRVDDLYGDRLLLHKTKIEK
jgi:glycine dehydrogenase